MEILSKIDAGRRVKQLIVTRAVLGEMLKLSGDHIPILHGVPEDARIVGMGID